jgi:2-alkenal reductase
MQPSETFWRGIAIAALALCGVLVAESIVRDYLLSATEPREIAPRTDLTVKERSVTELFTATAPSVVAITVLRRGRGQLDAGTGSGFVWDRAGHIVTNAHVVANAERVGVMMGDERALAARVIGTAAWADLAVLKLEAVPDDLQPIPVGRSADLRVGQDVLAIGNPFGLSRSLTTGVISALDRRLPTADGREVAGVIQTDAAINPGNSGGPLIDSAGRLIGVNTAILAPTGTFAGVGFAIPVDSVNRIVPQIINNGRAPMPGIGIIPLPEEYSARAGIRGVIIQSVIEGTGAAEAGLRGLTRSGQIGDVIVGVEGRPVATLADLAIELERIGMAMKQCSTSCGMAAAARLPCAFRISARNRAGFEFRNNPRGSAVYQTREATGTRPNVTQSKSAVRHDGGAVHSSLRGSLLPDPEAHRRVELLGEQGRHRGPRAVHDRARLPSGAS